MPDPSDGTASASRRPVILASASPRRSALLRDAGPAFADMRIMTSNVEEGSDPLENAMRKAEAVAQLNPQAIVIGADTVIRFEGEIIGKPADLEDAKRILAKLSGRTHDVATGVCVRCVEADYLVRFEEATHVKFRTLTPEIIDDYITAVNVLDKAGAYAIQEHGEDIIESINGSLTNVIGLPVERLKETVEYLLKLA
ncbi:MAG: septum formation protein Maf [Lentisphaeria bacterium]|nr:septum formation protein Maf [Lentisphaeria bacterium]